MDNTAQLSSSITNYSVLIQSAPLAVSTPTPTAPPTTTEPTSTPTAPSLTPSPTLPSPSLSFDCVSSTSYSAFNVQIQGKLAYNGVGLSGEGIQLSYSVTGGATWQDLAYVDTDNNGSFSVAWTPSASGNDIIKATWAGNNIYSSVSTLANFAVAPFNNQDQNIFSVTSNSTLTSLAFDSTTNELSFRVSGSSGTTGYTQVCVPQSLIQDISKLNVMLDGSIINYNSVSEGNVWVITFAYHHSSHTIVMALESASTSASPTPAVAEYPTWTILPLGATIILISTLLLQRKTKKIAF